MKKSHVIATAVLLTATLGAAAMVLGQPANVSAQEPQRSELEKFPGFRLVDWKLDDEAFAREELAREILISKCMKAQGHTYDPSPSVTYGPSDTLPTAVPTSSNDKRLAEMNPEGRLAYNMALYGVADPNSPTAVSTSGCLKEAMEEIPGVYALQGQLRAENEELRSVTQKHTDALQARDAWRECVAKLGSSYKDPDTFASLYRSGSPVAVEAWNKGVKGCSNELDAVLERLRISAEQDFLARHRNELEKHVKSFEGGQKRARELIEEWKASKDG